MSSSRKSSPQGCHPLYIFVSSSSSYISLLLLVISSLYSRVTSSPVPNVSTHNNETSTKLYTIQKTFNIRVAGATCASVSMMSSFITFYWFARMQKHFRHRLIMLLIFGDLVKASFLFLYAVSSIARGTVRTESAFCQSGGFFVLYGTETSDYAVLVIALHNALQVFHPSSQLRSDGLYPYRYFVYAGALVIPGTMAALAFVNPHWGYMSVGAFCTLPLRPFWYRLALAWIPRYTIAIVILGLTIAIYAHVGFEFRLLSNMAEKNQPSVLTTTTMLSSAEMEEALEATPEMGEQHMHPHHRNPSVVSMSSALRRGSAVASLEPIPEGVNDNGPSYSAPSTAFNADHSSVFSISPIHTRSTAKLEKARSRNPSGDDSDGNASPLSRCPTAHVGRQLTHRRARIHRQLRLMFIYPIVYIVMWLIPFVSHCMNYNDAWAAHPLYWLSLVSTICITLMGAVDCLIFSLRESPWRHIPSSDGTFLGSFICWRTFPTSANGSLFGGQIRASETPQQRTPTEANPETPYAVQDPSWISSVVRVGRSVRTSGSSDQAKVQAAMARTRLEMEMEDRRIAGKKSVGERSRSNTILDVIESPGDEVGGVDNGAARGPELGHPSVKSEVGVGGQGTGDEMNGGDDGSSLL